MRIMTLSLSLSKMKVIEFLCNANRKNVLTLEKLKKVLRKAKSEKCNET